MKEQEIIFKSVSTLRSMLPAGIGVRTRGGDQSGKPPVCILDWDSTRLGENGSNPYAGLIRDPVTDKAVGRELHRYHRMELDIEIRTYDESDRDILLSDVADAFLPYEYDASGFHDDTFEWEVGNPTPRSNPVVEPDWYSGGLTVQFKYVGRVEQNDESLTSIEQSINTD